MCSNQLRTVAIAAAAACMLVLALANAKEPLKKKKALVFDPKTPEVFYCPQDESASSDKMIVRARPLERLCQYGGAKRPKGAPTDCYADLDETDYACEEKKRFQARVELLAFSNKRAKQPVAKTSTDVEFLVTKDNKLLKRIR